MISQYISMFVEDLPEQVFEQFMDHMDKCAAAHRAAAERENRRIILTNLFLLCDHGGVSSGIFSLSSKKDRNCLLCNILYGQIIQDFFN